MTNLLADGIGRNIDWATFGIVVGIMSGVALVLALCIILISRFCQVKEDPRIKEVEQRLAGANCGACGHPGCAGFAKALVEGKTNQQGSANRNFQYSRRRLRRRDGAYGCGSGLLRRQPMR